MWIWKVHPIINIVFGLLIIVFGVYGKIKNDNDRADEIQFMSTAVEVDGRCTDVRSRESYSGRSKVTHYDADFTYNYGGKTYNVCITDSGQLEVGEYYILYVDPANPGDCRVPYTDEYRKLGDILGFALGGVGAFITIVGIVRWKNRLGSSSGRSKHTTVSAPSTYGSYDPNTLYTGRGVSQPDPFWTPQQDQSSGFNNSFGSSQPYQSSGFGTPQDNSYGTSQNNSYGAPQGNSYGAPQGSSFGAPQDNSYGTPQGNSYGTPQGNSYGAQQPYQDNNFFIKKEEETLGSYQSNPVNGLNIKTDDSFISS